VTSSVVARVEPKYDRTIMLGSIPLAGERRRKRRRRRRRRVIAHQPIRKRH